METKGWNTGLAVIGIAGILAGLVSGCGAGTKQANGNGSEAASVSTREGGSITLDATNNFKDLDPAKAYDLASYELVTQMYETLVTFKGNTSEIAPLVATSWEVSPDGKQYTFHLRKDAKFWNGDPVTAQSFIDEFKRVLSSSVSSPGEGFLDPIIKGSTEYFKNKAKDVSGLHAPDLNTLVITLNQPEPFFLDVLAMPFFSAVDTPWVTKVGNDAFDSNSPMGSGPFKLGSITTQGAELVKNPNYWMKDANGEQIPYLDKVTIRINTDGTVDALNFERGDTALIASLFSSGIPSSQYPTFMANPKLKAEMVTGPENAVNYIGMNTSMKPFDNKFVRQAVEYAINKDEVKTLLNNRVTVANQPLPPGIKGYVSDLPADATYTYDQQKAKELLAKAGYPHGFSTTLYSSNSPESLKIDNSIQNDLASIGIKASVSTSSFGTFLTANQKGNVQPLFLVDWIQDFPDASDFLNTLFNSSNRPQINTTMYSNKQVDDWLNKAQVDKNESERYDLYQKVTEQVMNDAPWVPLYYPNNDFAVQQWVHGYYINQSLADPLQYLWIDKSHR